ncbi:plasmalemma vesicle associated protein a [Centroberyx affinis]|uniref:plasmalemma vesicle associated protein a n=1 Tax=Centroberyx affinis TaxID=166261 RepID=UPI003A5C70D0
MYNSGYSQVSKFSLEAQKKMQHRSKGKSCGYYMRVVFFFSSLIQSLIIVSLVLFLVYGKQQDSASTARIQDLEQSFSRLSIENVALRQQRKNLTFLLNVTLMEKARNDWDLAQLRFSANISYYMISDLGGKLSQCNMERTMGRFLPPITGGTSCKQTTLFPVAENCNCGLQVEQLNAMVTLVQSNFTQTTQMMRMEMEQISRERDNINLEAIRLRRDKSTLEKEMAAYRVTCKEDFADSLRGISNVSRAFLEKIDSLFPRHIPFQLTCQSQRENLEQIRNNCTSLSREVEDKFQRYLNNVAAQVFQIQTRNSRLEAENLLLTQDYRWCSQNRTGLIQEHRQSLQRIQLRYDQEKERLLKEKLWLSGDKDVLSSSIIVKDKEIIHLKEQMKQLNMTCSAKIGTGLFPGKPSFGMGTLGQSGSPLNKFNTGGSSSSSSSAVNPFGRTTSAGSSGTGLNKPGLGTSSLGSSSSLGSNTLGSSKPGSNTVGSSSFGSNRLGSTSLSTGGLGSSSFGSTGSTSTAAKKPASTGLGLGTGLSSFGFGSSSLGNTGALGKTGSSSTGLGLGLGLGSSNTGLGKVGSALGKGTSSGSSFGGTGSSFGAGRTGGLGGGSSSGTVSVQQHLQDLQRIANPSASQDKDKDKDKTKTSSRLFG